MIFDKFDNWPKYFNIPEVLEIFNRSDLLSLEPGRYESSRSIFFLVQDYETTYGGVFESHKKLVDVQFVVKGEEFVGVSDDLVVKEPYDAVADVSLFDPSLVMSKFLLKPNYFAAFFPQDPHLPGLSVENSISVRKIVVKVPLELFEK